MAKIQVEAAGPGEKYLRVKPGSVELPHVIKKDGVVYTFAPDAKVPIGYAEALKKTYPHIYEDSNGNTPTDEYSFKKTFKTSETYALLQKLTDDEMLEVYEFANGIVEKRKQVEDETKEPKKTKAPAETKEPKKTEGSAKSE
jgi:hypothetical protein